MFHTSSHAQIFSNFNDSLIQFSGIVVTGDSLKPVSFTNIFVKGQNRGTVSNYLGYFSLVTKANDTLQFSTIGYKTSTFVIPDTLSADRYSAVHILHKDTFLLRETIIYPWPSIEQFKNAFVRLNIPDDDIERARKNLDPAQLAAQAAVMPNSGSMNFKFDMEQHNQRIYYAGQSPPINLFNPIAWAQFIQAWREGDFKKKK
ncbi:MAG: hypothetical protein ACJAUV_001803 [Flavobacteriales bacterium]|jgi:hypothetical protein